MKIRAGILALMVGLLIIQPLFARFGLKEAYGSCPKAEEVKTCASKKKTCSTKKKCSESKSPENKKNCESGGCNPLLGCSSGNFYIHYYTTVVLESLFIPRQKAMIINDNRVLKQSNDCWHPPEIV